MEAPFRKTENGDAENNSQPHHQPQMSNAMNRTTYILTLFLFYCMTSCFPALGAAKPTDAEADVLPEIWQKASPQERLKAVRAAEIDASRLLLEKIMSVSLDSRTNVSDLMLASDSIRGEISGSIKGVTTTEEPEYLPDGRVQLVRAVKVKQLYEIITRIIQNKKLNDGTYIKLSDIQSTEESKRDATLDAMGNSALPGSDGMRKIKSKRAAEMDAYRKLAERIMGVSITSDSTIRDFALKSDKVVADMVTALKGAETTGIKYKSDFTCEVTMQVEGATILRTVIRRINGVEQGLPHDSIQSKVFTETGEGAAPDNQEVDANVHEAGPENEDQDISETKDVVEKLVHQDVSAH